MRCADFGPMPGSRPRLVDQRLDGRGMVANALASSTSSAPGNACASRSSVPVVFGPASTSSAGSMASSAPGSGSAGSAGVERSPWPDHRVRGRRL